MRHRKSVYFACYFQSKWELHKRLTLRTVYHIWCLAIYLFWPVYSSWHWGRHISYLQWPLPSSMLARAPILLRDSGKSWRIQGKPGNPISRIGSAVAKWALKGRLLGVGVSGLLGKVFLRHSKGPKEDSSSPPTRPYRVNVLLGIAVVILKPCWHPVLGQSPTNCSTDRRWSKLPDKIGF